jgi:hypothetical protein
MVPHHRAVDVTSDNRIAPLGIHASQHVFTALCPDPEVHATLVHRAWPFGLSQERRWRMTETMLAEGRM